jgi:hypothetical protein
VTHQQRVPQVRGIDPVGERRVIRKPPRRKAAEHGSDLTAQSLPANQLHKITDLPGASPVAWAKSNGLSCYKEWLGGTFIARRGRCSSPPRGRHKMPPRRPLTRLVTLPRRLVTPLPRPLRSPPMIPPFKSSSSNSTSNLVRWCFTTISLLCSPRFSPLSSRAQNGGANRESSLLSDRSVN